MNKHLSFLLWLSKKIVVGIKDFFHFFLIESWDVPPLAVGLSAICFGAPAAILASIAKRTQDPVYNTWSLVLFAAWLLYFVVGGYRVLFQLYLNEQQEIIETLKEE